MGDEQNKKTCSWHVKALDNIAAYLNYGCKMKAQGMVLDLFLTSLWDFGPNLKFGIGTPPWHPKVLSWSNSQKFWVVDKLLLDHVGLPPVLDLGVHLVIILVWWVGGIILRHSYYSTFLLEHSFMLKSYRWKCAGGHVVMCRRPCGDVQAAMWWWPIRLYCQPQSQFGLGFGDWD